MERVWGLWKPGYSWPSTLLECIKFSTSLILRTNYVLKIDMCTEKNKKGSRILSSNDIWGLRIENVGNAEYLLDIDALFLVEKAAT